MLEALIEIAKLIFSVNFILTVITASTPLLLAGAGELVVERSGVLNLGVEGMMIMGAACGFAGGLPVGIDTRRRALRRAGRRGVLGDLRRSDARACRQSGRDRPRADDPRHRPLGPDRHGALSAPGSRRRRKLDLPVLTDLPVVGRILFGQDAFVYFSIALVIGIWLFLYRTRAGLVLRAVGDNHTSAHALGYPVLQDSHARRPVRRRLRRASPAPFCRSPIRRSSFPA